jgi:hypothetical protein
MARRDETPVTLPVWLVEWLIEQAYGEFTVAEMLTSERELEHELAIVAALAEARKS